MLHAVWLKVLVPLLAVAYVAYRVVLHVQISRARKAGDRARVAELETHGFRLYRWAFLLCLAAIAFLALVMYTNAR
jgi:hypothetical protein